MAITVVFFTLILALAEESFPAVKEINWRTYLAVFLLCSTIGFVVLKRRGINILLFATFLYGFYVCDLWIAAIKYPEFVSPNLIYYVSIITLIWISSIYFSIKFKIKKNVGSKPQLYNYIQIGMVLCVSVIFILLMIRNYN